MSSYKEYKDLLSKTYDEAVEFLLQKYGSAQDDYYREKSYQRFMNGEIKNITKGKFSRASEGLYCHHIDEKEELNISNQLFVKRYEISFEYQRKDRLVYCDLVEHSILHVLITKETSFKLGNLGFDYHLKPMIEEWYFDKIIPDPEWMKNCYNKSFLVPQEAFDILKEMQKVLGKSYYNNILDYYEEKKRKEEVRKKRVQEREQELKDERNNWIRGAKLLGSESPRQEIVLTMYHLKYKDPTDPFGVDRQKRYKEFDSKMKKYPKDKILEEIKIYLESLREINDESSREES